MSAVTTMIVGLLFFFVTAFVRSKSKMSQEVRSERTTGSGNNAAATPAVKTSVQPIDFSSYVRADTLLNRTEASVFYHIAAGLPAGYTLSTKVRLADLVQAKGETYGSRMSSFRRISAKHVDFVVHGFDGRILCLVEFDGPTHRQAEQQKRDQFLNQLCQHIRLPLVRINHTEEFSSGITRVFAQLAALGIPHRSLVPAAAASYPPISA